jgi:flagellar hook-associated protein 1 FlgK
MAGGISTFFGLNTALRGLQASQAALNVTSNNIANADTEGYSRQSVQLQQFVGLRLNTGAVASGAGALLGGGVDVTAYTRARDVFADLQYRSQSTVKGETGTLASAMDGVELALNEPGEEGISSLLSEFWDAWQEVANHPEDTPTKSALVVNAQAVIDGIQALDSNLVAIQTNAANQFAAYTSQNGEVLTNAASIAKLNAQIKEATAAGQQPNALLDQRDQLIDKLAELGQVTITELPYGSIQVAFGNVNPPLLVDDTTAWAPTPPATTLYATPNPGGKLGALQDISKAGGIIDAYRADLNTFVNQLVTSVNTAHGAPFFDTAGTTAATMAIDAGIAATPATIRTTNIVPAPAGANDVALAVAGLRAGTADRTYAGFVLRIGTEARDVHRRDSAADSTLSAASDRRTSISGVSIDEEMTNMIRFQRAYQASSRTMSTMDDMLDTLINRTGRVGL